ncbi:MAG: hypothetical protein KBG28_21330 [Kofleriaceae bacterium]|nr:hypothetical protein [Kofleriaceae bacterium]
MRHVPPGRRTVALIVATGLTSLAAGGGALAQPAPTEVARAAALYEQGLRHYNLAEYDQAAATFKEAYRLAPDPNYLFNAAQAARKGARCADARELYQAFVREAPTTPNRAKVEAWISELGPCADAELQARRDAEARAAAARQAAAATRPAAPAASPAPSPVRAGGAGLRLAGLISVGAGAAALGVASWQAMIGADRKATLADACAITCDWDDPMVLALDQEGARANRNAVLAGVVGGVAVAGGVGLYLWGRAQRGETEVGVAPTAGGAVATVAGRF